jgi:hemoglobin
MDGAPAHLAALKPRRNAGCPACHPAAPTPDLPTPEERVDMNQAATSLYERLGRREGITRITADLMKNHLANPLVNARYLNSADLARVERRVIEFFCAGTGGPESYTGKDMLATHKGMNISEQEFMSVIDDAMDALQKNGIDDATRSEVLAVLWSMRREVLRV